MSKPDFTVEKLLEANQAVDRHDHPDVAQIIANEAVTPLVEFLRREGTIPEPNNQITFMLGFELGCNYSRLHGGPPNWIHKIARINQIGEV